MSAASAVGQIAAVQAIGDLGRQLPSEVLQQTRQLVALQQELELRQAHGLVPPQPLHLRGQHAGEIHGPEHPVEEVALRPGLLADPAVQLDRPGGQEAQLLLVAVVERLEDGVGQPGRGRSVVMSPLDGGLTRWAGDRRSAVAGGVIVGPGFGAEDGGEDTVELGGSQRLLHHGGAQPGLQGTAIEQVEVLEGLAGVDELAGRHLDPAPPQPLGELHHAVEDRRAGHRRSL